MKRHIQLWVALVALAPLYVGVTLFCLAFLNLLSQQTVRVNIREQQLCDMARVVQVLEPIIPKQYHSTLEKFIRDVAEEDHTCHPRIAPPLIAPTPHKTPGASGKTSPASTQVEPPSVQTTRVIRVTKRPAAPRQSASPRPTPSKSSKRPKPPSPKPSPSSSELLCNLQNLLIGDCPIKPKVRGDLHG